MDKVLTRSARSKLSLKRKKSALSHTTELPVQDMKSSKLDTVPDTVSKASVPQGISTRRRPKTSSNQVKSSRITRASSQGSSSASASTIRQIDKSSTEMPSSDDFVSPKKKLRPHRHYVPMNYMKSLRDEQLQLALAMSASLTPDHQPPVETKQSKRSRKRRKVEEEEVPPLLTTSPSKAKKLTAERATEILQAAHDDKEEIPCTPAFGPSALAGGGAVRPGSEEPVIVGDDTIDEQNADMITQDDDVVECPCVVEQNVDTIERNHDLVEQNDDIMVEQNNVVVGQNDDTVEQNATTFKQNADAIEQNDDIVDDNMVEQNDVMVEQNDNQNDRQDGDRAKDMATDVATEEMLEDGVAKCDTVAVSSDEALGSGDIKEGSVPTPDRGGCPGNTDVLMKDSMGETGKKAFAEYKTMWELSSYHKEEAIGTFYAPALSDHIQQVGEAMCGLCSASPCLALSSRLPCSEPPCDNQGNDVCCSNGPSILAISTPAIDRLVGDLRGLLTSRMFADAKVLTGDGQMLPVHRAMLAARCPTLCQVMEDDLPIDFTAYTTRATELFLEFIYTASIDIPTEEGIRSELQELATGWCMEDLRAMLGGRGSTDLAKDRVGCDEESNVVDARTGECLGGVTPVSLPVIDGTEGALLANIIFEAKDTMSDGNNSLQISMPVPKSPSSESTCGSASLLSSPLLTIKCTNLSPQTTPIASPYSGPHNHSCSNTPSDLSPPTTPLINSNMSAMLTPPTSNPLPSADKSSPLENSFNISQSGTLAAETTPTSVTAPPTSPGHATPMLPVAPWPTTPAIVDTTSLAATPEASPNVVGGSGCQSPKNISRVSDDYVSPLPGDCYIVSPDTAAAFFNDSVSSQTPDDAMLPSHDINMPPTIRSLPHDTESHITLPVSEPKTTSTQDFITTSPHHTDIDTMSPSHDINAPPYHDTSSGFLDKTLTPQHTDVSTDTGVKYGCSANQGQALAPPMTTPIIQGRDIKEFESSGHKVTPMPNYRNMGTPYLKDACSSYGVRIMTKKKMVAKLEEIYDYTHPFVDENGQVVSASSSSDDKQGPAKKTGKGKTDAEIISEVKKAIMSDCELHQDILIYKPLEISYLHKKLKSLNVAVSKEKLMDILDHMCVTFSQPRQDRPQNAKQD